MEPILLPQGEKKNTSWISVVFTFNKCVDIAKLGYLSTRYSTRYAEFHEQKLSHLNCPEEKSETFSQWIVKANNNGETANKDKNDSSED